MSYCWKFILFLIFYHCKLFWDTHTSFWSFCVCIHGYFLKILLTVEFKFKSCENFKALITLSNRLPNITRSGGIPNKKYLFSYIFCNFEIWRKPWPFEKLKKNSVTIFKHVILVLVKLNIFRIFWQIQFLFLVFVLFGQKRSTVFLLFFLFSPP